MSLIHLHQGGKEPGPANNGRALFVLCPTTQGLPSRPLDYLADVAAFGDLCGRYGVALDVLAVNGAIADFPGDLSHAATLHAAGLRGSPGWLRLRERAGRPVPSRVHSVEVAPGVTDVWRPRSWGVPSSGGLGCLVGAALGYALVVTNMRLDTVAPYGEHQPLLIRYATAGALDRVRHYAPATYRAFRRPGFAETVLSPSVTRELSEMRAHAL